LHAGKGRIGALVAFLQAAAHTDPLTGLGNRRALESRLASLWNEGARDSLDLSIIMIDVDNFKQTNDRFGHAGGDALLIALADAVRAQSRKGDHACRYGGDEIVVLLPRAHALHAHAVADRLRDDFALRAGALASHPPCGAVGLSMGIASRVETSASSAQMLLIRADEALYAAKRAGKGCTRTSAGPSEMARGTSKASQKAGAA
jgi:diguanylate cyclase (GGDEF)-like protein